MIYNIDDIVVYNLDDNDDYIMLLKIAGYKDGQVYFKSPELSLAEDEYILGYVSEILRHATTEEISANHRLDINYD